MRWIIYGPKRIAPEGPGQSTRFDDGMFSTTIEADIVNVGDDGWAIFYKGTMVCDASAVFIVNGDSWSSIKPADEPTDVPADPEGDGRR
jgi:hypothetical protein